MGQAEFSHLIIPLIVLGLVSLIFLASKILEKKFPKKSRMGILLTHAHAPIQILLALACFYLLFEALSVHFLSNPVLSQVYAIFMILGFGFLAFRCLRLFASMILQYYELQTKDNYFARKIHTRLHVIMRMIKAMIIFFVLVSILMTFETIRAQGISLLASAGVVSIIVGFAAQKTMGNFFSGLQIAIAQPMRVEDVVVLENEWGTIEEIHLTYVVVKLWDLRRMIVPISYFTDHPFQNWTQRTSDILAPVIFYVDHGMPIQAIREEVDRILEGNTLWDKKVKVVQVVDILEHAMQVRVLASAVNSGTAFDLRCAIREELMIFMQKNYPEFFPRMRTEITREHPKAIKQPTDVPQEPVRSPAPTLSSNPKPMDPQPKVKDENKT